MSPYVARANVDHFLGLLQRNNVSPQNRDVITRLLIAEEDKLGHDREHLAFAESRLARGRERVAEIKSLQKIFASGTREREEADKLLVDVENMLTLLDDFCNRLRAKVDMGGRLGRDQED
jgi:hypothetical protein